MYRRPPDVVVAKRSNSSLPRDAACDLEQQLRNTTIDDALCMMKVWRRAPCKGAKNRQRVFDGQFPGLFIILMYHQKLLDLFSTGIHSDLHITVL